MKLHLLRGESKSNRSPFLLIQLLLCILPFSVFAETAPLLQKAEQLIKSEQYNEAYQLLQGEGMAHAGEADFDYLLGLAALRAGKPEQAMFALERCITVNPNHAAARMELVSAYTQLGMDHQAAHQLAILETQNPPSAAREMMARYQDVLRPRLSGTPDPVRMVGISAGYDSNVGSFPDMGLDLGGLTLVIEPLESSYTLVRGTLWQPVKLNDKQRVDLTLHAQQRFYQEEDANQFNLGVLHAGALLNTMLNPSNKLGVGLQANRLWLDADAFRDHLGLNTLWERRLGAYTRGEFSLEAGQYRFEESSYDYDAYALGARLMHNWNPQLLTALNIKLEQESAAPDRLGGDAVRGEIGGSMHYTIGRRDRLGVELSWTDTRYDTDYAAGTLHNPTPEDKARHDTALDVGLNWRHMMTEVWELNADASYRSQESSLNFYELERWTAQLSVLRYF